MDLLRQYWFVVGAVVLFIVLMLAAWLHGHAPKSPDIDASSGAEKSQLTMTVPKGAHVPAGVVAIFSVQGGLRSKGVAEVVGYENGTTRVRITVPSDICGIVGRTLSTEDTTISLADAAGNGVSGAPTPKFTVICSTQ